MTTDPSPAWELRTLIHIGLTLAALFAMLAVYVGVPALLGWLAGIRIERIGLGIGPIVLSYRRAGLEWVLGSIPIGAHAKFYGEEGLYGVRPEDWPANRTDDDEEEEEEADEEEEEDRPEEPPPPDSFIAAHPLVRTAISLSGPLSLAAVGLGLLWLSSRSDGPDLRLVQRSELNDEVRQNREARPWSEFPLFGDWMALPTDRAADAEPVDPLPEYPLRAAASVLKLTVMMSSPEGYAGYMSWPVLLVRGFEPGPAFGLSLFGLFAGMVAVINLLPLTFLHGGIAFVCLIEWLTGRRIPGRVLGFTELITYVWFCLLVIQIVVVDINRFG